MLVERMSAVVFLDLDLVGWEDRCGRGDRSVRL